MDAIYSPNMQIMNELPPSAIKVFDYLSKRGSASTQDLLEQCGIAQRTLRYALKLLTERQMIVREPVFQDMRFVRYHLSSQFLNQMMIPR